MSGKAVRETFAALGVIASLVFVGTEVRQNTAALEHEAALQRANALTNAFFEGDSPLPPILLKIKESDGIAPNTQAFMDRYDLSFEEAEVWLRHLGFIWMGLEAEYGLEGPSSGLEARVRLLLSSPDNQLFWESGSSDLFADTDFLAYVDVVRSGL